MAQIPINSVNNNYSTRSKGLFIASQFISGALADCILVVVFKMAQRGVIACRQMNKQSK